MLISSAYANAATAAASPNWTSFLPLIIIFILFWFMLIRPQVKQAKQQRAMLAALQKGDEVAAAGGIVGKITKVSDAFVTIEIAPETNIHVQKHAVQTLFPKGTIKSL